MKRRYSPKKREARTWRLPRAYVAFTVFMILIVLFAHSFYRFDRRILPLVLDAAELRLQAEINNVINSVIHEIITERDINAADFLIQNIESSQMARPVLSVNTVLVNEICNAAAQGISEKLNNLEPEEVSVPIGISIVPKLIHEKGCPIWV